jgi:hypothetical protein
MSYTPLEQKLISGLQGFAAVTALVGQNIFNEQLPQGLLSSSSPGRVLTIKRVSTLSYRTMDANITTLVAVRIQFTAWSNTASANLDVLSIMNALVAFLNQFAAAGSANQAPNDVLNRFTAPYPQTQPPLWQGVLDTRIFNREDLT